MEFCPKCGKVLIPHNRILKCSLCGYTKKLNDEDSKDYILSHDVSDKRKFIISGDKVNAMPTTRGLCYRCGNRQLEWWMVQMHRSDEAETRFYRCTKCGNTWRRSN
ncbi:MAG: transcription factor S [Methanosphaera sp. SHI613]|nr:MAG: transcription factor S [Methanosphaera sp. SHI613]